MTTIRFGALYPYYSPSGEENEIGGKNFRTALAKAMKIEGRGGLWKVAHSNAIGIAPSNIRVIVTKEDARRYTGLTERYGLSLGGINVARLSFYGKTFLNDLKNVFKKAERTIPRS